MTARISSLSMTNYSYAPQPSGSIQFDDGEGNTATFKLTPEDAENLLEVAMQIADRHRKAMAKAIIEAEFQPLLGYDSSKTIEADDDSPF